MKKLVSIIFLCFFLCASTFAIDFVEDYVVDHFWIDSKNSSEFIEYSKSLDKKQFLKTIGLNINYIDIADSVSFSLIDFERVLEQYNYIEDNDVYIYILKEKENLDDGIIKSGYFILCNYSLPSDKWTHYIYYFES